MSLSEKDIVALAAIFDLSTELLKPELTARLIGDECPPPSTTRSCSCWQCSSRSSASAD